MIKEYKNDLTLGSMLIYHVNWLDKKRIIICVW